MNWNAYPKSSTLSAGALVEVSRYLLDEELQTTLEVNDRLIIEFPNNDRAGGVVKSKLSSALEVVINGKSLALVQQGTYQITDDRCLTFIYIVR